MARDSEEFRDPRDDIRARPKPFERVHRKEREQYLRGKGKNNSKLDRTAEIWLGARAAPRPDSATVYLDGFGFRKSPFLFRRDDIVSDEKKKIWTIRNALILPYTLVLDFSIALSGPQTNCYCLSCSLSTITWFNRLNCSTRTILKHFHY